MYEAGMAKAFGCKFKGRLGHGPNDLSEMRVLNRIVRIVDSSLQCEADPQHAELLAISLNLLDCEPMVTPCVKLPFEQLDTDKCPDDHNMDNVIASAAPRRRFVNFDMSATVREVPFKVDYSGKHPNNFVVDHVGRMVSVRRRHDNDESNPARTLPESSRPNSRRPILRKVLRDVVAWELQTVGLISKISKSPTQYMKARPGTKAVKSYEKLENVGDLLDDEALTMFRALAARFL